MATDEKTVQMNTVVPESLRREAKILAAQRGISMSTLQTQAFMLGIALIKRGIRAEAEMEVEAEVEAEAQAS